MFQSELPYDVKSYPYSGYTVADDVETHVSYGAGVYHYFRDYNVTVQSAIACPTALESSFHDPLAVFLNGNGKCLHILNDKGPATSKPAGPGADPQWICAEPNATHSNAGVAQEIAPPAWMAPPAPPATCAFGASVPCPSECSFPYLLVFLLLIDLWCVHVQIKVERSALGMSAVGTAQLARLRIRTSPAAQSQKDMTAPKATRFHPRLRQDHHLRQYHHLPHQDLLRPRPAHQAPTVSSVSVGLYLAGLYQ